MTYKLSGLRSTYICFIAALSPYFHACDCKGDWDPRLEGIWRVTEDVWDGRSREVSDYKFIVTEGVFAFAVDTGEGVDVGAYRVSVELKEPDDWIVMREEWPEESADPWLGLYDVQPDTLRIVFGKARPTSLTPPKNVFTPSTSGPRTLTMVRLRPRADRDKAANPRRFSAEELQGLSKP
jgi:hypothetical protein